VDDLEAEHDQLEALLAALSPADWKSPSAAAGWTVADVVLHLAQTEEQVPATLAGENAVDGWRAYGDTVDAAMAAMVASEDPGSAFDRWRAARRASVAALRAADPAVPVRWVAGTLKPRTLATTRLAEHWAHAQDVAVPLGADYPDTVRLRHIAWLGHSTLPYAFRLAGQPPTAVRADLTGPDGEAWSFGDPAAASVISGPAGAFCRVGAQRLAPAASGLATTGPDAGRALSLLRNYAAV